MILSPRIQVVVQILFSSFVLSALYSTLAENCLDNKVICRKHETCCPSVGGSFMCCPVTSATCCPDGIHCCPSGTKCNISESKCAPGNILESGPEPKWLNNEDRVLDNDSVNGSDNSDVIPDWFYGVQYCVTWQNPYKLIEAEQCTEIFQRTEQWDICDGDHIDKDCYRNIRLEFSVPSEAPAWWVAVQVLSDSPVWSTRFILRVPGIAPAWLQKVQLCFYKNGSPYCAPADHWTPAFVYEKHMMGAFGFLAS